MTTAEVQLLVNAVQVGGVVSGMVGVGSMVLMLIVAGAGVRRILKAAGYDTSEPRENAVTGGPEMFVTDSSGREVGRIVKEGSGHWLVQGRASRSERVEDPRGLLSALGRARRNRDDEMRIRTGID